MSSSEEESGSEDSATEFFVEAVSEARVAADTSWEYHVKWLGWTSDADTWEPDNNLNCEALLKRFWRHVGMDTEDYAVGHVIAADSEFIEDERKRSREQHAEQLNTEQQRRKAREKERKEKKKRKSTAAVKKRKPAVEETKTKKISGVAKSRTSLSASAQKTLKSQGRKSVIVSESEDSDDTPLSQGIKRKQSKASLAESTIPVKVQRAATDPDVRTKVLQRVAQEAAMRSPSSDAPAPAIESLVGRNESSTTAQNPQKSATMPNVTPAVKSHHAEPRVKILELPLRTIAGGSTLETKLRLASGSKGAAAPASSSIRLPDPVTGQRKKSLSSLSFKRKTSTVESTAAGPSSQKPKPPALQTQFLENTTLADSPADLGGFFGDELPVPDAMPDSPLSAGPATASPVNPLTRAAESFLASIMPSALAAPMTEGAEPSTPKSALYPPKPKGPYRIPKKWKWTGELSIKRDSNTPERCCDVFLSEATEAPPQSLSLSFCFNASVESLKIGKVHHASHLATIMRACQAPTQYAKMMPAEHKDGDALRALATHLGGRDLFAHARLKVGDVAVGLLLLVPTASSQLCSHLSVSGRLHGEDFPFALVALPWALPTADYKEWLGSESGPAPYPALPGAASASNMSGISITSKPGYHRSIAILKLPQWLHEFLHGARRTYCIWDGAPNESGLETQALLSLLGHYPDAKNVGHHKPTEARLVFVHVGSLPSLHKLAGLLERRAKRPITQFVTYGTHDTVRPDRWGICTIYPLGGIVTFTARAIDEDVLGVCDFIKKVGEHPLWDAYIVPTVLVDVVRLSSAGQDPLALFDRGTLHCRMILDLIEAGALSMLRAPPLSRSSPVNDVTSNPAEEWIVSQLECLDLQSRGILESCLRYESSPPSDTPSKEAPGSLDSTISADLSMMSLQPVIMDNYRRFVVITAKDEEQLLRNRDGFEWVSLSHFDFRDEWFGSK